MLFTTRTYITKIYVMLEKDLWKLVKNNISGHKTRIENAVSPGFPDCFCAWSNRYCLLELKIIRYHTLRIQKSQLVFFHEGIRHGARIRILAYSKNLIHLFTAKNIIKTKHSAISCDKISYRINELKGYTWASPYNWNDISDKIYRMEEY